MTAKNHEHGQQAAKKGRSPFHFCYPRKAVQANTEQGHHSGAHKAIQRAQLTSLAKKYCQKMVGVAAAPGEPFACYFVQAAGQVKGKHGSCDFIKIVAARKQKSKGVGKGQQQDKHKSPPQPAGCG